MSQFKKFKAFAEAKEKGGFAGKNGLVPNQDIPKADKGPDLMKLKSEKPLGGRNYKGQMSTNPIKGTKENPLPYKGNTKNDHDKRQGLLVHDDGDLKSGFAFKGNKVQTPKNSASLGEEPKLTNVQKVKSKGKMTSEQFIQETKDMSPAEFISFFVEGSETGPLPTITDLYGNEFTPDPNQTIQYLAALMVKNPRLLGRFVREMKRHDKGMNLILDEHFSHPEFYSVLAEGMAAPEGEGRKRCHRMSRAMNNQYMSALEKFMFEEGFHEEVQPKADLAFEDGGPMGSPPQNPSGMAPPKRPKGGAMGGGGAGGDVPPPGVGGAFGGGGVGGPMPPPDNGPPQGGAFGGGMGSPAPDMGGPGMPGAGPEAGMPPGMPGAPPPMPPTGGTASGGVPGLDMGTGGQPPSAPMPKFKGETAHGNMIEEMGGFPHMFSAMADYCINCKDKKK